MGKHFDHLTESVESLASSSKSIDDTLTCIESQFGAFGERSETEIRSRWHRQIARPYQYGAAR